MAKVIPIVVVMMAVVLMGFSMFSTGSYQGQTVHNDPLMATIKNLFDNQQILFENQEKLNEANEDLNKRLIELKGGKK